MCRYLRTVLVTIQLLLFNRQMLHLKAYNPVWERRDSNPQVPLQKTVLQTAEPTNCSTLPFCPPGRLRSDSPHIKSMVLSRLSYEGFCLSYLSLSITIVFICLFNLVECVRIERLPNVPNILCNHYTTHSLFV